MSQSTDSAFAPAIDPVGFDMPKDGTADNCDVNIDMCDGNVHGAVL